MHSTRVWTYCPRAKVDEQSKADAAPYGIWEAADALQVTEGDVVDYRPMKEQVRERPCHDSSLVYRSSHTFSEANGYRRFLEVKTL